MMASSMCLSCSLSLSQSCRCLGEAKVVPEHWPYQSNTDLCQLKSSSKADVTVLCHILMTATDIKLDNKALAPILGLLPTSAKNV